MTPDNGDSGESRPLRRPQQLKGWLLMTQKLTVDECLVVGFPCVGSLEHAHRLKKRCELSEEEPHGVEAITAASIVAAGHAAVCGVLLDPMSDGDPVCEMIDTLVVSRVSPIKSTLTRCPLGFFPARIRLQL